MSRTPPARIVILGGGFAGVFAARELEREWSRERNVDVTLVAQENFLLFTPMLHEVAASDVDLTHIVNPIRALVRRARFVQAVVERIDLDARVVEISHGASHHHHELPYDHLVLALGSVTNFYGLPGLEERALTMKSLGDAIHLRNQMIQHLEEADFECSAAARSALLTFVVAGGGFAGVETVAAVNDFLREAISAYRNLTPEMLRLVLVHAGPRILPELQEPLGHYAAQKLESRGVELHLDARLDGVSDEGVTLSDGTRIPTRTLVWTAGTSPHPLIGTLLCPKERGRVRVGGDLAVEGWDGVWALGDCAAIPDPDTGGWYPPTAQHALREARRVAQNIAARLRGQPTKPFRFRALGSLAAIGRRTGVAQILGFRFSGFVAWWMWRTIYLGKLPRMEKKLRVMIDWTLDLFFAKDLVEFRTGRAPTVSHPEAGAPGRSVMESEAARASAPAPTGTPDRTASAAPALASGPSPP
jgi:NADH dehydrogenase